MQLFKRILHLIDILEKGNQSEFARKIGYSQSTLNGYLNEKGEEKIRVVLLQKILNTYPEISDDWLYKGKEPVFKDGSRAETAASKEEVQELKKENERLKKELAEADRLNRQLTTKLFMEGYANEKSVGDTDKAAGRE